MEPEIFSASAQREHYILAWLSSSRSFGLKLGRKGFSYGFCHKPMERACQSFFFPPISLRFLCVEKKKSCDDYIK